jgi:hypothetical protein
LCNSLASKQKLKTKNCRSKTETATLPILILLEIFLIYCQHDLEACASKGSDKSADIFLVCSKFILEIASLFCSSSEWAYVLRVVVILECPKISLTVFMSMPISKARVAKVWRIA